MKVARWVIFGLIVGGSLLAAILYYALSGTRDIVKSADRFLTQVAAGRYSTAYGEMSGGFRSRVGQTDFERRVRDAGLDRYVSATWSSRRVKSDWARAYGTIATRGGGSVPMRFDFVYDGQYWVVSDFFVTGTAVPAERDDESPGPPPSPGGASPSGSASASLAPPSSTARPSASSR